jgi:K+-sensing histidine kinase KdpD
VINQHCCRKTLRGATLTIAVLVVLFCLSLTLATFLRLGLSRLAALLALSVLSGLAAALLTFLLHIVSHKAFLLKKRETFHAFEICH